MTTKKNLKQLIHERAEKTGESYMVARRHVLAGEDKLCPVCGRALADRTVMVMPEPDEDDMDFLTDGQAADYHDALQSDDPRDWGDWAVESTERFCSKCDAQGAVVSMRKTRLQGED